MDGAMDYSGALLFQKIFKGVMNAFAHPLQVYNISDGVGGTPLTRGTDEILLNLCCMFLDNTVSFCVCGDDKLAGYIEELTYAKPVSLERADFVIIRDIERFDRWDSVYRGTLVAPDRGATVIIETERFEGDAEITASGPGINGSVTCSVDRGVAACLRDVAGLDIEYPMGFERIFITRQGDLFAVPRHIVISGEGF